MGWVTLPTRGASEGSPSARAPQTAGNPPRRGMESSWLETRWARPFYLAFVCCLALGLLQAIKLYLRRQRLLRDLRAFPGPSTHWFYGHQKVEGREGQKRVLEPGGETGGRSPPLLPAPRPAQTSLAQPAALGTFSLLGTCSLTAPRGKGNAPERKPGVWEGADSRD